MGNFTITKELIEAYEKKKISICQVREATPEEFYEAIGRAKVTNEYGAFVTQHSVDEYVAMKKLLLTEDGTAGIAITQDNNIVSIFNGGARRGVLKTLMPIAIENGGRKLDNYNSDKLSAMYELYGFEPISKVKFDKEYAPLDWNYERDGFPDVVFWIHNGESAQDVVIHLGQYIICWDDVKEFPSYEDAEKFRDELIELIDLYEKQDDSIKDNIDETSDGSDSSVK